MSTSENREKLRRYVEEVLSNSDAGALPEYVHDDVIVPVDFEVPGSGGIAWLREHLRSEPSIMDYAATVQEMLAEGDKVAARVNFRGKLVGEFMGLKPNGKEFNIDAYMLVRFRDGKIAQFRRLADHLTMLRQVGGTVVPAE